MSLCSFYDAKYPLKIITTLLLTIKFATCRLPDSASYNIVREIRHPILAEVAEVAFIVRAPNVNEAVMLHT